MSTGCLGLSRRRNLQCLIAALQFRRSGPSAIAASPPASTGTSASQLPWYDLATGAVAHVARHYLGEGGTVYDLGCATGNIGRALAPTLEARKAKLIPVEASLEMAAGYNGPQGQNMVVARAEEIEAFEPCDVAVLFLTMMFIAPRERLRLWERLVGSGTTRRGDHHLR